MILYMHFSVLQTHKHLISLSLLFRFLSEDFFSSYPVLFSSDSFLSAFKSILNISLKTLLY